MFMLERFFHFNGVRIKNKINKNLKKSNFLIFFLRFYIFITATVCPYFGDMINDFVSFNQYSFFYFYFFLFVLNIILHSYVRSSFLSFDLVTEYIVFFLKNTNQFVEYLVIRLKKIFYFLINKKLEKFFFIISFFKSSFLKFFYLWRPLFKRFSYFGNFRLVKNKNYKNN